MEGSIPDNPRVLARICGCTLKEINRLFPRIRDQFVLEGDRLINPKAAEVRERVLCFHEARKKAGTDGAKKRWAQAETQPSNIPAESREHPVSIPRAFDEHSLSGPTLEPAGATAVQTAGGLASSTTAASA
jgi:uncharacterized protein YdaU (DUF1376 family)